MNNMNSLSENNNIFVSYPIKAESLSNDNQKGMKLSVNESRVNEIWTKSNFSNRINQRMDLTLSLDSSKMSWSFQDNMQEPLEVEIKDEKPMDVEEKCPTTPEQETVTSPSHHARRPMNAFLIFCKKHRPIVRNKYPNLENRGVTRILGDWWALLDGDEKNSYTKLAKEYKDAFFSANPYFKWYKLPAPPLRTLPTRPVNVKQESPPVSPGTLSPTSEFTPGKLADESQLGRLSSLLNNASQNFNVTSPSSKPSSDIDEPINYNNNNQNDNNNKEGFSLEFTDKPIVDQNTELPPKPIKKRYAEEFADNKNVLDVDLKQELSIQNMTVISNMNMTNQEIVNKVIDNQFFEDVDFDKNNYKDTRKSDRKGKGNRYAEFMANGKLIKNKRDKRDNILNNAETPKLDLNNTIKRLEERIQPKIIEEIKPERVRTVSEMSESDDYSKAIPSFNLDQRISELPTLSYEEYVHRKKDSKKRKFVRNKQENKIISEMAQNKTCTLIGSKKRKNKHNITHLEKSNKFEINSFDNDDLSGLTTLAEIAAQTEKIIDST